MNLWSPFTDPEATPYLDMALECGQPGEAGLGIHDHRYSAARGYAKKHQLPWPLTTATYDDLYMRFH